MLVELECFRDSRIKSNLPDQMPVILLSLSLIIGLLMVGGLFVDPITAFIQRRYPKFAYDGGTLLLWGGLLVAAFGFGLVVMYLVLRS